MKKKPSAGLPAGWLPKSPSVCKQLGPRFTPKVFLAHPASVHRKQPSHRQLQAAFSILCAERGVQSVASPSNVSIKVARRYWALSWRQDSSLAGSTLLSWGQKPMGWQSKCPFPLLSALPMYSWACIQPDVHLTRWPHWRWVGLLWTGGHEMGERWQAAAHSVKLFICGTGLGSCVTLFQPLLRQPFSSVFGLFLEISCDSCVCAAKESKCRRSPLVGKALATGRKRLAADVQRDS